MELERIELEREIVRYDKQKLITEVLKIWEVNNRLAEELLQSRRIGVVAIEKAADARNEVERLKGRTLWQVINERLEYRIEKIRNRRKSFNYPTK